MNRRVGAWLLPGIIVLMAGSPPGVRADGGLNLLFYGNSFTNGFGTVPLPNSESVPLLVRDISIAAGNPAPNIENAAVNGQDLAYHLATNTGVISTPQDFTPAPGFQWDAVILQEFSTKPTHIGNPTAFRSDARNLFTLARQQSPTVRPILYETWARAPGNTAFYPNQFPDPSAMQQELHDNYQSAQTALNSIAGAGRTDVAPVGDAFKNANWTGLYDTDLYHASHRGYLLSALTLYATIYHDNTSDIDLSGILGTLGLSASDGQQLTAMADAVAPGLSKWSATQGGQWSLSANWSRGVPRQAGAAADFGPAITQPTNVTNDGPRTISRISFSANYSYTLGGSTLTLAAASGAGPASLRVASGSHVIAAPLILSSDLIVQSISPSSGLSINGVVTATGRNITKTGPGTVSFQSIRAAGLTLFGGTTTIAPESGVSAVNALSIAALAKLDLTNNAMVIDYPGTPGTLANDLRKEIQSGLIISSAASPRTRLGYADNASLGLSSFSGVPLDASSAVIAYTLAGDTNLDHKVDIGDLRNLATHWHTSGTWIGGDFDYNGLVDSADLALLAMNWQGDLGAAGGQGLLAFTSVPEPIVFSLASTWFGLLLARRKPRTAAKSI